MQTPERIWLHPITEDDIQDAWFADGVPGDVEYVSAAALTEAQATIARLETALTQIRDREPPYPQFAWAMGVAGLALATLSPGKGE